MSGFVVYVHVCALFLNDNCIVMMTYFVGVCCDVNGRPMLRTKRGL